MLNNVTMFRCYKEDPKTIRELNSSFLGNGCAYYGECGGFIYYYHRYPSTGPPPALKIDPSCSAFYYPMNKSISKHINKSDDVPDVFDLLSGEFDLQWHISNDCADCRRRGGLCQTDWSNERHCINAETKSLGTGRFRAWIWIVVAVSVSTLLLLIGFVYCKKAKARGTHHHTPHTSLIHGLLKISEKHSSVLQ
ncbi:OLC1v1001017C1 [Oldenlandia corymbosa var. corymbosa]|uniref:OLC1v1001017C1 n=1 Tax=Oldenlandia corymbosa var. corymbosa TaxID=529605 RepID=A0AAV1D571_OLDCO|nr:OLC1v1001017C1 [Oldenlandia corymbosa var. corymbosa]